MDNLIQKKPRNYGIDLLKMLSMFLVVCVHIYMQGGVLSAEQYGSPGYYCSSYIYTLALCAVDCFVIVSGYVSCKSKFRLARIIELWVTVVFWSVAVSCIVMAIQPGTRSLSEAVSMFLPILRGRYWFFNAYFVLFMFKPILNHMIATISEAKYKVMLFVIVCILGFIPIFSLGNDVLKLSGGAEFCWFFMLYLIGGYLRKYCNDFKYSNYWNLAMFFILAAMNIVYKFITENITSLILGKPVYGDLFLSNLSPIVLGEAVFLFLFFSRIHITEKSTQGKWIRAISPLVFSVYIIHVHPIIFWNSKVVGRFAPLANFNPLLTTAAVCGSAVIVYITCIALDVIRMKVFALIKVRDVCDILGAKISTGICRFLRIERTYSGPMNGKWNKRK